MSGRYNPLNLPSYTDELTQSRAIPKDSKGQTSQETPSSAPQWEDRTSQEKGAIVVCRFFEFVRLQYLTTPDPSHGTAAGVQYLT